MFKLYAASYVIAVHSCTSYRIYCVEIDSFERFVLMLCNQCQPISTMWHDVTVMFAVHSMVDMTSSMQCSTLTLRCIDVYWHPGDLS